jgi:hypothetical protein
MTTPWLMLRERSTHRMEVCTKRTTAVLFDLAIRSPHYRAPILLSPWRRRSSKTTGCNGSRELIKTYHERSLSGANAVKAARNSAPTLSLEPARKRSSISAP